MQCGLQSTLFGDVLEASKVPQEDRPLIIVHIDLGVIAVVVGTRAQDNIRRPRGGQLVTGPFEVLDVGVHVLVLIQDGGNETAHHGHVVTGDEVLQLLRIAGQEAVGAEFGGTQARFPHFRHHPGRIHQVAPPSGGICTPGDGSSRDPAQHVAHSGPFTAFGPRFWIFPLSRGTPTPMLERANAQHGTAPAEFRPLLSIRSWRTPWRPSA